jgi:hypothetical protein
MRLIAVFEIADMPKTAMNFTFAVQGQDGKPQTIWSRTWKRPEIVGAMLSTHKTRNIATQFRDGNHLPVKGLSKV